VPRLVDLLVAGKTPEDRDEAWLTLHQTLYANGTVSPAGPPAIALLCQVLTSGKDGAHRAGWLIGDVPTAWHERVFAEPSVVIGGAATEAAAAVVANKDAVLSAVTDPDARVRAAAAFALAWAPDLSSESLPILRKQLAMEAHEGVTTSLLLSLGVLAPSAEDAHLLDGAAASSSPLVRGAAALARLLHVRAVSPALVRDVVAFLQTEIDAQVVWWCAGQAARIVAAVGRRAGVGAELAAALAEGLGPEVPAETWKALVPVLLGLAGFTARWAEQDVALPEELTEAQRAVAKVLASRDGIEGVGWGVPRSGRDRRRWIGAAPAGPLEKRVRFELDGNVHDWPIWKVWRTVQERGLSNEELPAPVSSALTPAGTLEALAEVSAGAYRIREIPKGARASAELIARVAAEAGPDAAAWARRYADEILALVEASSTPELGGVLGMPGFAPIAVYLAVLNTGAAVEPRWYRFVPLVPVPIARIVLEKMGPTEREEAVWQRTSAPGFGGPPGAIVDFVLPLLDLVPSKRIALPLVTSLRNPQVLNLMRPGVADAALARIRGIAETQPAVADALA
jgi:hypothetical protein